MLKKSEYVAAFAERAGISKAEAARLVDVVAELNTDAAKSGTPVLLPGVGKLTVVDKPARTGRNPSTGETVSVPARRAPKVAIAKALKDAVSA